MLAVLFVVCLILACFFSSAETAFIGTQKLRLQHLAESGRPGAKLKMRVLAVFLATMFLKILSLSVSPMVGWPSVKKTMVKGRSASLGRNLRAASRAGGA